MAFGHYSSSGLAPPCGEIPTAHTPPRHDVRMTLRLDPRYPLVWRTPTSLQFGVDDPPVRLENVTIGDERMIAALTVGATPTGVELIGTQSGLTKAEVARFQLAIRPALESVAPAPPPRIVVVAGTGPTVDRLGWRLREAGLDPRPTGERPSDAIAAPALRTAPLAIVVGHYVLDPEFYGLWLRRDIPHIPIVYGDTSVRIGPLIEPGCGPCLYCLDRHRTDADAAWPAIASQLWGRRSTAETPFLASEAATVAARIAVRRLAARTVSDVPRMLAKTITIDAATGATSRRSQVTHPECACRGIDGTPVSVRALPGTGTARSPRSAARPTPTTKGEGLCVPA